MKHYTVRGLMHDAKVFYQLWLEHRQTSPRRQIDRQSRSYLSDSRGANPEFGSGDLTGVMEKMQLIS